MGKLHKEIYASLHWLGKGTHSPIPWQFPLSETHWPNWKSSLRINKSFHTNKPNECYYWKDNKDYPERGKNWSKPCKINSQPLLCTNECTNALMSCIAESKRLIWKENMTHLFETIYYFQPPDAKRGKL